MCHKQKTPSFQTIKKPRKMSESALSLALGTRPAKKGRSERSTLGSRAATMNAMTTDSSHRRLAPLATIPACQRSNEDADWFPPVDILEDAEEYLFKIDLPEVKSDEIRVVVERDGLFITGERPEPGQENKKCLRVERPHGHFERRFALPDDASRGEIDTAFKESVLELRVRKVRPLVQNPATANALPRSDPGFAS